MCGREIRAQSWILPSSWEKSEYRYEQIDLFWLASSIIFIKECSSFVCILDWFEIKTPAMSFVKLDDIAPFSLVGITLNTEEKTVFSASLAIKKQEEKFDHVYFWGKILGVQKDYYIAQAFHEGEWFKRKYFYT